jgi:pimeloyl-ACP methyl ester carboxylesterase
MRCPVIADTLGLMRIVARCLVAAIVFGVGTAGAPAVLQAGDTALPPTPIVRPSDPRTPPVPPGCRLGWQPSILAPVFFGYRELGPADGPPMNVLVSFPSIGTRHHEAVPLTECGRYPLVLLLNGQCVAQPDHYTRWALMASRLARAGYVVVTADMDHRTVPWDNDAELNNIYQLLYWMRTSWEYSSILLPRPATAVIGHSYGALLAGRLAAAQVHPFSAYVSLSGVWSEYGVLPLPLDQLDVPSLFTWGVSSSDASANIDRIWETLPTVKHKLRFPDAAHFDYLRGVDPSCAEQVGPNPPFVRDVTTDMVTAFLSHYLPPEFWTSLRQTIPHSLVIGLPLQLEPSQVPYATNHLPGFARLNPDGASSAIHTWVVRPESDEVVLTGD